jgi:DNA-binding cell septation regulator SpoVG
MHINIEWRTGKYPSFNIHLATKEGKDAFMTIRGCKIIESEKGQFVSFPSRKMDDGKYWNHVWSSKDFNDHVLNLALESQPKEESRSSKDDDSDDIPF